MKIKATVSWNPEVEFGQANLVDIVLSFKDGLSGTFSGQLSSREKALTYLDNVNFYAQGWDAPKLSAPVEQEKGRQVYEIPVTVADAEKPSVFSLRYLMRVATRIQDKYYIAPRDEIVTDEEYCQFFGSSGNLWDTNNCDYPSGDFVETIRQTVYDMEHGNPQVFLWTDVPRLYLLNNAMGQNPDFNAFAKKELKPLVVSFWKWAGSPKYDRCQVQDKLNRIADIADKFKR